MKPSPVAFVSDAAYRALMYEIAVTPKPGLVDASDTGAHRDMTRALLEKSAGVISPYFGQCALYGFEHANAYPEEIFPFLKEIGLAAEKSMFEATGNINTHKGAVFCFCLLSGAYGMLAGNGKTLSSESIARRAGEICFRSMKRQLAFSKNSSTSGERAFYAEKLSNARVEALSGYPHLVHCALPAIRYARFFGKNLNESCVFALIALIAHLDDTCLYARGGIQGLNEAKELTKKALCRDNIIKEAKLLNTLFIQRNLSPGGSADLLAAAIFLMLITSEIQEEEL